MTAVEYLKQHNLKAGRVEHTHNVMMWKHLEDVMEAYAQQELKDWRATVYMWQARHNKLQEENKALSDTLGQAIEREKQLKELLEIAKCPHPDCKDGAYPIPPDGDAEQCEWCEKRKTALNQHSQSTKEEQH